MFDIVILSTPLPHFWPLCQSHCFSPLKIIHSVLCAKKGYLLSQCPSNLAHNSLRQSIRVCHSSPLPLPLTLHTRHFLDFQQALLASVLLLTVNIQSTSHINMTQLRASSKAGYRPPRVEDVPEDSSEAGTEPLDNNKSNTSDDKSQSSQSVDITSLIAEFDNLSIDPHTQHNSLGEVHKSNEEESAFDFHSAKFTVYTPAVSEGIPANSPAQIQPNHLQGSGSFTFHNIQVQGKDKIFGFCPTKGPLRAVFRDIKSDGDNLLVGCFSREIIQQRLGCPVGSDTVPGIQPAGNHTSSGLGYRTPSPGSDGTGSVESYVTVPGSPGSSCDLTHHGLSVDTCPDGEQVVTQDPSFHSWGP